MNRIRTALVGLGLLGLMTGCCCGRFAAPAPCGPCGYGAYNQSVSTPVAYAPTISPTMAYAPTTTVATAAVAPACNCGPTY